MTEGAEKESNCKLPRSYHTFIYPFTYETGLDRWIASDQELWTQIHLCNSKPEEIDANQNQRILEFNEYQYFLPKARRVLYAEKQFDIHDKVTLTDSPIFSYELDRKNAKYIIIRKIDPKDINKNKTLLDDNVNGEISYAIAYELCINQLTLQLFPEYETGIFTFELENYEKCDFGFIKEESGLSRFEKLKSIDVKGLKNCNKKDETTEQIINNINNFGRRITVPCIGINNDQKVDAFLNADLIQITGLGGNIKIDDIVYDADSQFREKGNINFQMPIDVIAKVLFRGSKGPPLYKIKPVLDDRMFTACLYRKNNYPPLKKAFSHKSHENTSAANANKKKECDTYRYLEPEIYRSEANRLYQFVFLEDSITCCNIHMLREKLKKHVLGRWIDWGTIHAATEYSLVCVTGENPDRVKDVINPFLTEYVNMVKLALIQRAIITSIEEETQRISDEININDNGDLGTTSEMFLKKVEALWQKYIQFETQLYMPEVTFQEQGVELYDLIKNSLRIRELNEYLKDEITNLHNVAALKSERNSIKREKEEKQYNDMINNNLNMLTIAGVSLALITFIVNFISAGQLFVPNTDRSYDIAYFTISAVQIIGICIMIKVLRCYYSERLKSSSQGGINSLLSKDSRNSEGREKYNTNEKVVIDNYIEGVWDKPIWILICGIVIINILMPWIAPLIISMLKHICPLK